MKRIFSISLAIATLVFAGACQLAGSPDTNVAAIERDALVTHLAQVEPEAGARAAAPYYPVATYSVKNGTIPVPTLSDLVLPNYPESGQTSTLGIAPVSGQPGVYKVSVSTSFPGSSVQQSQAEVYYLKDDGASAGFYDSADHVVAPGSWTADSRARETMQTVFVSSSGSPSTRLETIVADKTMDGIAYAAIDVNGSLDWSAVSASAPAAGAATWSSTVVYTQAQSGISNFAAAMTGFPSSGTYATAGTRHYTESAKDATHVTASTLWIEEIKAPGGVATFARTVTRESYELDTVSGARGQKSVRSRTILYDNSGKAAFSLDKSNWLLSVLLQLF